MSVIELREVVDMRIAPDLGIPEEKPAIESIRGRWERKVSAQRRHAILQGRVWALLTNWARDRGEAGTEWRFYLLPEGDRPSSLVPDVAYYSFERLPVHSEELREKPTIAPDIAAEILSPDDRESLLHEKIALYVTFGTRLVIVVHPEKRRVDFHERGTVRRFTADDVARSDVYVDLAIDLPKLFAGI